ncbi:hypothetical protein LZD49_35045 [Dyadobacter sp. CY261]|uniref:hypothetical protein n=1 Tax=Dyadobacter sp. CY261 TaxID=2907203 RepID=UPI001F3D68C9|nr:hypothetical protein [Dyadobacter sp. CY261]MCF0075741.1 hypothetical protein [Dyadobacter sp. CY261]
MRTILFITDDGHASKDMVTLLRDLFALATIYQVNGKRASRYLESNTKPDLIVYMPGLTLDGLRDRFFRIKALAGRARILLYAEFELAGPSLFDYLAAGANGLLSKTSSMAEHHRALDTVMRGDSFVDDATKRRMLMWNRQQLAEWKSNIMTR